MGNEGYAVLRELFQHHCREFRIPFLDGKFAPVHDAGFEIEISQGFAHLHGDKPGSDYRRSSALVVLDIFLDIDTVPQILQDKDSFEVRTRDIGQGRRCSRRYDKGVIGHPFPAIQENGPCIDLNCVNTGIEPYVYARFFKFFRGSCNQPFRILDYITDVIGNGSGGIGNEFTRFQYHHIQRRISPFCLSGCGRSSRASSNDYEPFVHAIFPFRC